MKAEESNAKSNMLEKTILEMTPARLCRAPKWI
jgi:hypothetical protein